jgi:hypothetical protein
MKKLILLIFLAILGSIAVFAQKADDDFQYERGEKYIGNIEQQCYDTTNSYSEFKRCVENNNLPICPQDWESDINRNRHNFPCRYDRTEDYWEHIRRERLEKYPTDWVEGNRIQNTFLRQQPNEQPESFESPFPPFVNL